MIINGGIIVYNYYNDMYYDNVYPIRYAGEVPHYPAPDHRPPYPMPEHGHAPIYDDYRPCPDYPMPMPMPVPMPEETLNAIEYLDNLFKKLMGQKVNIIIECWQRSLECVKIIKVEQGVVVVEVKSGNICVIPLDEISAVCMGKEMAEKYYDVK